MNNYNILTAIPTAFDRDGTLNIDGTREIFRYVAKSGNEGAFVLGTTGEFPAVDAAEFREIVEAALEELCPAMRVIVHVGRASTFEAVRLVQIARELGATEFAALTPYYLTASDAAIYDYFAALANAVDGGKLYVYVYPARSGNPVSPELLARLAEIPQIVGAKASELTLDEIAAYRAAVPETFELYTGADRDLIAATGIGAQGVVSGVSSVTPKPFRALADAGRAGDDAAIVRAQADVDAVVDLIGGDMARMKEAYRVLGVVDAYCRMALDEPDAVTRELIASETPKYA